MMATVNTQQTMHTTLADYILETVQNAIESGAEEIDLIVTEDDGGICFELTDNGCGMTAEQRKRCLNPYYSDAEKHPGRTVGLGLSLLAQLVELTGGRLDIDSERGRGTRLTAWFDKRHIDTPPAGELEDLFLSALCFCGEYELRIERRRISGGSALPESYRLSRMELREALGSLEDIANISALRTFLRNNENEIRQAPDVPGQTAARRA